MSGNRDFFHTGLNVGRSDISKIIGTQGPGKIFYVDSNKGAVNNPGTTWPTALATLDAAVNECTADSGDKIKIAADHSETVATASAITLDVAGIDIECLGEGENRPTFSFSGTAATMVISAASVRMVNFIVKPTIDSVVSPIVVTGTDCTLDYEHQDTSATVEALRSILTTATADRLTVSLKYRGFLAGNAVANAIRLVGVDTARIYVDFYGVASTSIVEFHTTACHDIDVRGIFYNNGTSLTKNVLDTVTGSTWSAEGWDGNSSAGFSGGDNAALAGDDVGAVKTDTTAILVDTSTTLPASIAAVQVTADAIEVDTGTTLPATLAAQDAIAETSVSGSTAVMVNGDTIFTIAGGLIKIVDLVSVCITLNDGTASTLQYSADPTVGAATTFSGASATLANFAAGGGAVLNQTALATAPDLSVVMVGLGSVSTNRIIVNEGIITVVIGVGSTTGTWKHYLRYIPLSTGVTVTAA